MTVGRVLLAGGVRTAHGRFGGSLRDVRMVDLATTAARACLERTGIDPAVIDELILSCRHQAGNGPNPARTVALLSGLEQRAPAHTVNMACASGMKAIQLARQAVLTGDAEVVLVVAADSMSTMPYYGSYRMRWEGARSRDITLVDGWTDGRDPVVNMTMGQTAERLAREFAIEREAQDAWALTSHHRAAAAWERGRFQREVVPVAFEGGVLERDETIRTDSTPERLAALRPVFDLEGTVTAGNASQMCDAAAAVLVLSDAAADRLGVIPLGHILAAVAVGVDPRVMGIGPVEAIPAALARSGHELGDMELIEINEAFGAQIVQNVRALALDPERVNVNGGSIALGHPTGETGTRIVTTLLHELAERDLDRGVASLCIGGGQGMATVVERIR